MVVVAWLLIQTFSTQQKNVPKEQFKRTLKELFSKELVFQKKHKRKIKLNSYGSCSLYAVGVIMIISTPNAVFFFC